MQEHSRRTCRHDTSKRRGQWRGNRNRRLRERCSQARTGACNLTAGQEPAEKKTEKTQRGGQDLPCFKLLGCRDFFLGSLDLDPNGDDGVCRETDNGDKGLRYNECLGLGLGRDDRPRV